MSVLNAIKVSLTPSSVIARKNEELFQSAVLRLDKVNEIDSILSKLIPFLGQARYIAVAKIVNKNMPWWFICLTHAMEAGGKQRPFEYHLHCGDPLYARTTHVPIGRPKFNPHNGITPPSPANPYQWEESAVDALQEYKNQTDFSLGNILYQFEKFNGLGYRKYHPSINSPYIWSYTNKYVKGKYTGDGKWDANAVSKQPGCAAFLLRMKEQGIITI